MAGESVAVLPLEFTPDFIVENSPPGVQPFADFLSSPEPYRSINTRHTHISARDGFTIVDPSKHADSPTPGMDLHDDELYYNTQGEAAEYWAAFDLPRPRKDIRRLRRDLEEYGYCLVSEALSAAQLATLRERVYEQAAGERAAGVATWMGTPPVPGETVTRTQFVPSLFNKGEQLCQCVAYDPAGVQGGPVIEQLISEAVGADFIIDSFNGIIANKHGLPQGLHMDQGAVPFMTAEAPLMCNQLYIMDDMSAENGGTLVVPMSHKITSAAGSAKPVGQLPPAINVEAPAGTVIVFEGRLL